MVTTLACVESNVYRSRAYSAAEAASDPRRLTPSFNRAFLQERVDTGACSPGRTWLPETPQRSTRCASPPACACGRWLRNCCVPACRPPAGACSSRSPAAGGHPTAPPSVQESESRPYWFVSHHQTLVQASRGLHILHCRGERAPHKNGVHATSESADGFLF